MTASTVASRFIRLIKAVFGAREGGILMVVLAVFGVTTLYNHSFADPLSVQQLLVGASVMIILAVGETLVVITRNVDLSIGSVLGLSAYVVGDLFAHNPPLRSSKVRQPKLCATDPELLGYRFLLPHLR